MRKLKVFSVILTCLPLTLMAPCFVFISCEGTETNEGIGTTAYTVTFNLNGGNGTPPPAQTVQAGSSITLPGGSGLFRSGYGFGGWSANSSGAGINYAPGSLFTPDGNITLYARWESAGTAIYTVSFEANGGYGWVPEDIIVSSGESIELPYGDELTRPGYIFGGWNADPYGTGYNYQSGGYFTPTGNTTLWAVWDWEWIEAPYTVSFDANGGDGWVSEIAVAAGESIELPYGDELTRPGYIFGGWNADPYGTGYNYQSGGYFTPEYDIILYARWIPVGSPSIEYYWIDQHGDLVTTSNGAATVAQGGTLTITAQDAGYMVLQWHLNGINTGENGDTYNFSSTTAGKHTVGLFIEKDGKLYNANITVTVLVPYTVTFNANGATSGTAPNPQTVQPGSGITLPGGSGLSRTGYIFGGWNADPYGTGYNYQSGGYFTPEYDITLYARWITVVTRTVIIDMYDSYGDGWDSGGALRINKNGVQFATNVRVSSGYANTYTFSVTTGDLVQLYWVAGTAQSENSFIAYYSGTPPSPAFTSSNNSTWSGSNALAYRLRGAMNNISGGTLLGSFTVQ